MREEVFYKYRPLIGALVTGAFYCWFAISDSDGAFMLMLFLPGITFPFVTSYFHTSQINNAGGVVPAHLALSVGIYYGCVWLFSAEGQFPFAPVLAGFIGSLMYVLTTKWLLKIPLKNAHILFAALLSGLAFIFGGINNATGLGWALFGWTMINGALLTYATKDFYE